MSNETEWVLVPREPDDAMKAGGFGSAAYQEHMDAVVESGGKWLYDCREAAEFVTSIYAAMLAAAPQPPAEAQAQDGGEVFGWVLGDAFVDARFWTAGTPPWGWTPVYRTAPPSAPVGVGEILAEMHEEGQADIVDGGIVLEWVDNLRNALAQQPAADGGFTAADMMDARQEGRREAQPAAVALSRDELETCRQWFDSVQDTNGGYLTPTDYVLAAKLYRSVGMRVPDSIGRIAAQPGGSDNDR